METHTTELDLRGDHLADAITEAISANSALPRGPEVLRMLQGPLPYHIYPSLLGEEIRRQVHANLAAGRFATLAAASALAEPNAAVSAACAALLAADDERYMELGRLIAHGTVFDLDALVDEVSLEGWRSVAAVAGMELDERSAPFDREGRLIPLPMIGRHLIATLVDDAIQLNLGWLSDYDRRGVAELFLDLESDAGERAGDDEEGAGTVAEAGEIQQAEAVAPSPADPEAEEDDDEATDPESHLGAIRPGFITLDSFLPQLMLTREYLIGSMLERGLLTVLIAPPGMSKTTLGIHITVALAAGQSWAG